MKARTVAIIIASALVFVLAASVILIDIFVLRNLRQRVESVLSHTLAAPVGISSLSLDIFRGLACRSISVSNSGRRCVTIDEVFLKYDPSELLNRKLAIKEISGHGLKIIVSDSSNDYTAYYETVVSRFTNRVPSGPSLLDVRMEKVLVKDVSVIVRGKPWSMDSLGMEATSQGRKFTARIRNLADLLWLDAVALQEGRSWTVLADYKVLEPNLRKVVASGHAGAAFTNFKVLQVTNVSQGPSMSARVVAVVDLVRKRLVIPDGSGTMIFRENPLAFSGSLSLGGGHEFRSKIAAKAMDASLLSTDISGRAAVQADLEGSLDTRKIRIISARMDSDALQIRGLVTNTLVIRQASGVISGNCVKSAGFIADFAGGTQKVSLTTSDIFSNPLKADIRIRGDRLDLEGFRLAKRRGGGTASVAGATIGANAPPAGPSLEAKISAECGLLQFRGLELKSVSASGTISQGSISGGRLSATFRNASLDGTFGMEKDSLTSQLAVRHFDAGQFVSGLSTSLDGEIVITADLSRKTFSGKGAVRDELIKFRGFEFSGLSSSVTISTDSVSLEDGSASFYKGGLAFSAVYLIRSKALSADISADGVDVETLAKGLMPSSLLIKTYLNSETSSVSGTASCKAHLNIMQSADPLAGLEITGNIQLRKGIIQDTLVQQQYAGLLGDAVNYFMYDEGGATFSVKDGHLKLDDLSLVSAEEELHSTMDYDIRKVNRNERHKLMLSGSLVERLNNVAQLPVVLLTKQEKQWRVFTLVVENNKSRLEK